MEKIEKWRMEGKLGRIIKSALELSSPNRLSNLGILNNQLIVGEEEIAINLRNIFQDHFSSNPITRFVEEEHPEVAEAIEEIKRSHNQIDEHEFLSSITPL